MNHACDLVGRHAGPLGQLAHLVNHDGKAAPLLAGARGFDGGIKRQQIGLVGNFLDDAGDAADFARTLDKSADQSSGIFNLGCRALDLVAGFHSEPISLLAQGKCELVVGSAPDRLPRGIASWPLFRYEIQAVLSNEHRLRHRRRLEAEDFAGETLITYPVAPERLDVFTRFLVPGNVLPKRHRSVETTDMMLQLVAAERGVSAVPDWLLRQEGAALPIRAARFGAEGLAKSIHLGVRRGEETADYLAGFLDIAARTEIQPPDE